MKNRDFCILTVLVLATWVLTPFAAAQEGWGHLKGRIVVEGALPEIPPEVVDKDQATCLRDGQAPLDDNLVVSDDGGLRDAFVMMYFKGSDPAPPIHPSYEESLAQPAVLDNKNCRFDPHAIFVRTGQSLELKNSDDVGHNCHIITFRNEQNINLARNDSVTIKFTDADKSPGNVVCDIHKWMDAVILIRDEPYAAITGPDGSFEIRNIPAGTWRFQFWHKKTGYMKDLDIPDYKVGRIKADIEVTIEDGQTLDLGTMKFPASSFKD